MGRPASGTAPPGRDARVNQQRLVVRTVNSLYEVLLGSRRFRRLEGRPHSVPPLSVWWPFDRLGPVVPGRPMRFWWSRGDAGRVAHFDVLTTAPVVDVDVVAGDEEQAVARQGDDSDRSAPGDRRSRPTEQLDIGGRGRPPGADRRRAVVTGA